MKTKTVPVFDYSKPMMSQKSYSYQTRKPLPQYRHPVTGIVQDYSEWIDEGWDYDLVGAGFVAVEPTQKSEVKNYDTLIAWLRS